MSGSFATLTFERRVSAPVATLWAAWTAPAARAIWAPPAPSVRVDFLEADTRVGGREISLCKVEGELDNRDRYALVARHISLRLLHCTLASWYKVEPNDAPTRALCVSEHGAPRLEPDTISEELVATL